MFSWQYLNKYLFKFKLFFSQCMIVENRYQNIFRIEIDIE